VFRRAALGGPLHVAVGATQLLLRRLLAEGIRVELQGA
jgi:ferrous iron transport protein A